MKRIWQRLTGKRQAKQLAVTGRWFTASLIEANMGAGQLAYGW